MAPQATSLKCQVLDASHIEECASVMAQSFADSPSYRFIFQDLPSKDQRIDALTWLFQRNLMLMATKCPSALRGLVDSNDSNKIVACSLWTPAPLHKLSLWEMLRAGLWKLPIYYGWHTLKRLMSLLDEMEAATQQVYAQQQRQDEYIMLERMVVRPEWQGKGFGSQALRHVLESESPGTPVRLSTQELRNVTFYERLGFVSLDDRNYFPENQEFQFTSWTMIRT